MFVGGMGLRRLVQFCEQLSSMLASGRPIEDSLGIMERRGVALSVRPVVRQVRADIQRGMSLAQALDNQGRRFPALMRNLIRVAEQSGNLEVVVRQIGEHYRQQLRIRNRFLVMLIYPGFMAVGTIVVLTILAYVLTMLDPDATRTPEAAAGTVFAIGMGLLAAVVLGYFLFTRVLAETRMVQEIILNIPLVGRLRKQLAWARFSWAMSLMLGAGDTANNAMRRALESTGNGAFTGRIPRVADEMARGARTAQAIESTRLFPPGYVERITVAEESGEMEETFGRLADENFHSAINTMQASSVVLFWLIWLGIAAVMIVAIFYIATKYYIGAIQQFG